MLLCKNRRLFAVAGDNSHVLTPIPMGIPWDPWDPSLPHFHAHLYFIHQPWASTTLEHWGVEGRAPKTRESRRRRRRGRWGLRRGCAPSQKIYEFSSQNGVIWCILGVLFLRFMCPTDCSCMINFTEVPVCARSSAEGKNKTLVKILGGRQHRTTPVGQILGGRDPCNLTPMTSADDVALLAFC